MKFGRLDNYHLDYDNPNLKEINKVEFKDGMAYIEYEYKGKLVTEIISQELVFFRKERDN
mgnify:CR=1 FL=1